MQLTFSFWYLGMRRTIGNDESKSNGVDAQAGAVMEESKKPGVKQTDLEEYREHCET